MRLAIPAAKWMGNFRHDARRHDRDHRRAGGVAGVAANLRAGVGYQLVEFTVAFLRSPAVDGRSVTATAIPVKIGRRLSTVDVELHDADGILSPVPPPTPGATSNADWALAWSSDFLRAGARGRWSGLVLPAHTEAC